MSERKLGENIFHLNLEGWIVVAKGLRWNTVLYWAATTALDAYINERGTTVQEVWTKRDLPEWNPGNAIVVYRDDKRTTAIYRPEETTGEEEYWVISCES